MRVPSWLPIMNSAQNPAFGPFKVPKTEADKYSSSSGDDSSDTEDHRFPDTNPEADDCESYTHHKRKRKSKNPKEKAALGIFASDSDDEGPKKRWQEKKLRKKGMSFVSGTTQQPTLEDKKEETMDEHMRRESPWDEQPRTGLGGHRPGNDVQEGYDDNHNGTKTYNPLEDDDYDFNRPKSLDPGLEFTSGGFVPSSSMQPTLDHSLRDEPPPRAVGTGPSAFGKNAKMSFAQRQMAKMGWKEGQGLGKEQQGRQSVIEVNLRPMGMGLGGIEEKTAQEKKEEKRQAVLRGEKVLDSDEEERIAKKKSKAAGKVKAVVGGDAGDWESGDSTPRQQQRKGKFLTATEINQSGMNVPPVIAKIFDLTGAQPKTITSSSGLMTPTMGAVEEVDDGGKAEDTGTRKIIEKLSRDVRAHFAEVEAIHMQKKFASLQIAEEEKSLSDAQSRQSSLMELGAYSERLVKLAMHQDMDPATKWAEATSTLADLSRHENSQNEGQPAQFAVSALVPIMESHLKGWDVLEDPTRFAPELVELRVLLGAHGSGGSDLQTHIDNHDILHDKDGIHRAKKSTTDFESLVHNLWFPRVVAALNTWDPRQPAQPLALFEAWSTILPSFVRSQIIETVVRKLEESLKMWKPRKHHRRDLLPHEWLFGWLPYLPEYHRDPMGRIGLVSDVRRTWRRAIESWDFRDGVIPGLEAWKPVLGKENGKEKAGDGWYTLVMNHLIPRMAKYLGRHFSVDLSDPSRGARVLDEVFRWKGILSKNIIGELLAAQVFPKWHMVLYDWVLAEDVDYADVATWLEWWVSDVVGDEWCRVPAVQRELEKALTMVDQALVLGKQAKFHLKRPVKGDGATVGSGKEKGREGRSHREQVSSHPKDTPSGDHGNDNSYYHGKKKDETDRTFKDVMEDYCLENDYQLIPLRNKVSPQGLPVFRVTARNDGKGGLTGFFGPGGFIATVPGSQGVCTVEGEQFGDMLMGLLEGEVPGV